MTASSHPVARIQDLIDQLKSGTRARTDHNDDDLLAIWNQLEDLLVMLVTPRTKLYTSKELEELKTKADLWDRVVSLICQEKVDVDTIKETGGIDQDRRSDHGDGSGSEGDAD